MRLGMTLVFALSGLGFVVSAAGAPAAGAGPIAARGQQDHTVGFAGLTDLLRTTQRPEFVAAFCEQTAEAALVEGVPSTPDQLEPFTFETLAPVSAFVEEVEIPFLFAVIVQDQPVEVPEPEDKLKSVSDVDLAVLISDLTATVEQLTQIESQQRATVDMWQAEKERRAAAAAGDTEAAEKATAERTQHSMSYAKLLAAKGGLSPTSIKNVGQSLPAIVPVDLRNFLINHSQLIFDNLIKQIANTAATDAIALTDAVLAAAIAAATAGLDALSSGLKQAKKDLEKAKKEQEKREQEKQKEQEKEEKEEEKEKKEEEKEK